MNTVRNEKEITPLTGDKVHIQLVDFYETHEQTYPKGYQMILFGVDKNSES